MIILAIDPGVAGAGNACALMRDGVLMGAWFERVDRVYATPLAGLPGLDVVVIERPQQDERSRNATPAILMALAWEGALLAGAYAGRDGARIVEMTPHDWKGSEHKPQHHARLWEALAPAERVLLGGEATRKAIWAAREKGALNRWARPGVTYYPRAFTTHNLLDAAALACHYAGRLPRAGDAGIAPSRPRRAAGRIATTPTTRTRRL